MNLFRCVMYMLAGVGALNWGLAAFDYNLVAKLLGSMPEVERTVYILVGVSGIYVLYREIMNCTMEK